MLVAIRTPADNVRGPRYMEKVLVAVHQAVAGRGVIRLEFGHHEGEVGFVLPVSDGASAVRPRAAGRDVSGLPVR